MALVAKIASLRDQSDLSEDEKRLHIYALKTRALLDVIQVGRTVEHEGFSFRINDARMTDEARLFLDVTFARGPSEVTHQIIITNPPVLPRERTGDEKADLKTAISEMLEGIV